MNKWAEMRNPPCTVQEAFNLADRIESQIQVANSFKLELTRDFSIVEVNEISTDETSGDEYKVNEVSHVVRNGIIITENQIMTIIIEISAGKPTKTPGHKIIGQVRGGNKKRKILK